MNPIVGAEFSPKTLRLIGLAAFASMASMRICDPMLITLAREFRGTAGEASRVISAFAVSYGLLQLIYGPLGDRIGKVRVIVIATLACSLFSALTALAPTIIYLVVARAAMGAAAAGIIPLSMAWIAEQVPYVNRQETLARLMGATVTGMMMGQLFGGLAVDTVGWRAAFMGLSAVFLIAATLLHRHSSLHKKVLVDVVSVPFSLINYLQSTSRLLEIPRVRWVLAVVAVEGALAFGTLAFVPSRLVNGFGFSASGAGGVMMLYGVGGLLYSQFARRWIGLLGEQGLALAGGVLIAAALLVLGWASQPWMAAASCPMAGLGFYMLHNTLQTQATQMTTESKGTAVTLFACLLFFGQSFGVMVVAQSVDRGALVATFTIAAFGVLFLAVLISRRVQRRRL